MSKQVINAVQAPKAIGCYSHAVKAGSTIYLSGQIGLDPVTMEISASMEEQTHQVFKNMQAVAAAAGATLSDAVKLTIYLTEMAYFPIVNKIMADYFVEPYPARSTIGVKELPKGALVEVEGILVQS